MRYTPLLMMLALAACDTAPVKPATAPETVTVEVGRVVYKACPVEIPEKKEACKVANDEPRPEWLQCRLSKDALNDQYIMELETALRLCAGK